MKPSDDPKIAKLGEIASGLHYVRVKALEANELAVAEAIQYAIQFTWGFLFARGAEVCGAFV